MKPEHQKISRKKKHLNAIELSKYSLHGNYIRNLITQGISRSAFEGLEELPEQISVIEQLTS